MTTLTKIMLQFIYKKITLLSIVYLKLLMLVGGSPLLMLLERAATDSNTLHRLLAWVDKPVISRNKCICAWTSYVLIYSL